MKHRYPDHDVHKSQLKTTHEPTKHINAYQVARALGITHDVYHERLRQIWNHAPRELTQIKGDLKRIYDTLHYIHAHSNYDPDDNDDRHLNTEVYVRVINKLYSDICDVISHVANMDIHNHPNRDIIANIVTNLRNVHTTIKSFHDKKETGI